jgi:hypothetical protein
MLEALLRESLTTIAKHAAATRVATEPAISEHLSRTA